MLLRVEKLALSFGGVRAVNGVDFEVRRGSVAAIIGPNGAGKSTLFNLIAGVYRPDAGRVLLEESDVTGLPAHARAARGVGRTFQATHLFDDATVLDNVIAGTLLHTRSRLLGALLGTARHRREQREGRERARAALETAGVVHLAGAPVGSISQEARKRVAIAIALATGPRLLLLDEPSLGLAPRAAEEVLDAAVEIRRRGTMVLLAEQNAHAALRIADRGYVLESGAVALQGERAALLDNPGVRRAYLGL
jgi:branched-chain amino acid transport system ATP-binding protein